MVQTGANGDDGAPVAEANMARQGHGGVQARASRVADRHPPRTVGAEARPPEVNRPPEASRPPGELVSAVRELHHDLRQPVATIQALVAAAERQPGVPDQVLACLERIAEQSQLVLALCRHVLEQPDEVRPTPLGHLASEVAESCRTASGCTIDVDADRVVAVVDEVALRRVVQNLVENAIRAAGPSGRVRLRVRRDGNTARISVADSGPGFRAGLTGAGRGLSIVDELVRRHGGAVEFGASDEMGGADVSVILPSPVVELTATIQDKQPQE